SHAKQSQLVGRSLTQSLRIDVNHERREQDQSADQYLQETVDIDMIEPVVEDAKYEQTDNGIADAAAAAKQAGATDHDGRDGIQKIGVEFVLLRAAEMRYAQHAADAGAHGRDHHDAAQDQLDVEPGIFGCFAVSTDHVYVAAEACVCQHEVTGEQHC